MALCSGWGSARASSWSPDAALPSLHSGKTWRSYSPVQNTPSAPDSGLPDKPFACSGFAWSSWT